MDPAANLEHAVAGMAAVVDALLGCELALAADADVVGVLRGLEVQLRRLAAVDARLVAEVHARGVAAAQCLPSTPVLLGQLLNLSPAEASGRVRAAADLGPRRELSGAPLDPIYPAIAAALTAGSISSARARVIRATLAALPGAVEKQYGPAVEKVLVERAQELPPHKLAQLAEDIRDALDPDGSATDEKDRHRRRELTLRPSRDGGGLITGYLTPETLAVWQSVLDTLAAPLPAGEDGITDTRTAAQRAHDGFHEAGMRLLRSGDLPDVGGTPVTVLLTVSAADLAAGSGVARTAHGGRIRIGHTSGVLCNQALCGEATLIGVELDTTGGILSYGTARRLASPAQRRALAARDRGCSFPGGNNSYLLGCSDDQRRSSSIRRSSAMMSSA
jgi:hypothetical protein